MHLMWKQLIDCCSDMKTYYYTPLFLFFEWKDVFTKLNYNVWKKKQ